MNDEKINKKVGVLALLNNYNKLENILINFHQQLYTNKKLFLILRNNPVLIKDCQKMCKEKLGNNYEIIIINKKYSIGYCLNTVINKMKAQNIFIFSRFDNISIYEPKYLIEQVAILNEINCDIVGKDKVPYFIPNLKEFFIKKNGMKNTYHNICLKNTITFIINKIKIRFNEKVENPEEEFLTRINKIGKIYITSQNNFINTLKYFNGKKIFADFIRYTPQKINGQIYNILFDKIFVINLKSHRLRKQIFIKNNERHKINFTFIEGIQGNIDHDSIRKFNHYRRLRVGHPTSSLLEKKINKKLIKKVGQIGYLKSMLNIFTYAQKNKLQKIIIFDDDCILHNNFNNVFFNVLKSISTYDILKIGSTWHKILLNKKYLKSPYFNTRSSDGSFAVCYDNNCFDYMIKNIKQYNIPFDMGCLRNYQRNNYSCYPFLAIADVYESTITKNARNLYDISKKTLWNLNNFWFKNSVRKVSVIFVIKNNEKTIEKSLSSIINQTYQNLEIILVNNLSNDKSFAIINNLIKRYNVESKVKIIHIKESKNTIFARNKAYSSSTGDFILFHNPNYISMKNRIENQMNEIIRKNVKISFTAVNTNSILDKYTNQQIMSGILENIDFSQKNLLLESMIFDKYLIKKYGFIKNNFLDYIFIIYKKLNSKIRINKKNLLNFIKNNKDNYKYISFIDKALYIK